MTVTRAVLAAAVAAFLCSPALAAAHASTASCSTKSLTAGGAKVVKVEASSLSCAKARAVARLVAGQLAKGGSIDVPKVAGFSMSSTTCTGCGGTTTQVTLTYSSGARVTISIRGGKLGSLGSPVPQPLPTPSLPSPGTSGSGPITV